MTDRMTKEIVINAILSMLAIHGAGRRMHLSQRQGQPVYIKSRDGTAAAVRATPELLAGRDDGGQCMVGELL